VSWVLTGLFFHQVLLPHQRTATSTISWNQRSVAFTVALIPFWSVYLRGSWNSLHPRHALATLFLVDLLLLLLLLVCHQQHNSCVFSITEGGGQTSHITLRSSSVVLYCNYLTPYKILNRNLFYGTFKRSLNIPKSPVIISNCCTY
jgi:hypothetical protein